MQSPRRGTLPRLRDVRIRSKLAVIMVIPILAVMALAVMRVADISQTAMAVGQAKLLMQVAESGAQLTHELQVERAAVSQYLLDDAERNEKRLSQQTRATDTAVEEYDTAVEELGDPPETLRDSLRQIDDELGNVTDQVRHQVYRSDGITMSDAVFQYRVVIADLITFRRAVAQFAESAVLADKIRAAAAISQVKEGAAQEQISVVGADASGGFIPPTKRAFISTLTTQEEALYLFASLASPEQRKRLDTEVSGEKILLGAELERSVLSSGYEEKFGFSSATFSGAIGHRVSKLRAVESYLDDEIEANQQAQYNAAMRQMLAESLAVLLVLFLAVVIVLFIARSMARSLQRLREGALKVAYESLPQSVAQLRAESIGDLTPEQVAGRIQDPVQVRGRDEIGQVSQAFNVVHREAVRIAAEQAALRANVATMFINLARRSQALVDRLIGHLDRLERGEEDPDRLAELFQLDHLATRMRRNDENLLVLAGADSTRVQRESAPLSDVLRAAQSEVEQYTRVEFGIVDRDVEVAPHAVNDVVHLLAELLDNASSFSPPETVVVIDGRRAGDRAILQIEDRGIGISAEQLAELNARLAEPPLVDVAVSRMMGLVVVGRLGARHGIRVELRAARERGTIADVILPAGVLILPQRGGRQQSLGLPPGRPPLALEGSADRAPEPAWEPSPQASPWSMDASGWDAGPDRAGATGPVGDAGRPPSTDRSGVGGAFASGHHGSNGSTDRELPRRRPGDRINPAGQPEPASSPAPERHGPSYSSSLGDAFSRRPPDASAAGDQHYPQVPPHAGRAAGPEPARNAEPQRPNVPRAPAQSHDSPPDPRQRSAQPPRPGMEDSGGTFGITGVSSGGFPMVSPRRSPIPRQVSPPGGPPPTPRGPTAPSSRPAPRGGTGAGREPSPVPTNADDTMELPIFREVESAWFRTKQPRRPAPQAKGGDRPPARAAEAASAPTSGQPAVTDSASMDRTGAATVPGNSHPRSGSASQQTSWRTAADEGWRAASAAAQVEGSETTGVGLPKRTPMAQLVPGGVEAKAPGTHNRSPDAVRGLLSAYHRGVQRGRRSSARTGSSEGPGKEQA